MKKFWILCMAALLVGAAGLVGCGNTSGGEGEGEKPIDMNQFPHYVEDVDSLSYSFGAAETRQAFWRGNIVYNESVLLLDDGNGAKGSLAFVPTRVISVRDDTLKKEYVEGVDFTVEGRVIRAKGENVPSLTTENLLGMDVPEPYRQVDSIQNVLTDYVMMGALYTESPFYYGNQLSVTYAYDVRQADFAKYPRYDGTTLPKLSQKLTEGGAVKLVGIGDSVLEGCSSSGTFDHEPFMDNFITLAAKGLDEETAADVTLKNLSVGGMASQWGCGTKQIAAIVQEAPDVVFIHFGINDAGAKVSKNMFRDNIESLILGVRDKLPDCEFVFLTAFCPNLLVYDETVLENYWAKAGEVAAELGGVKVIDVYSVSRELYKTKQYTDLTGNGINHVNDFAARIYTMSILTTLVKN